MRKSTGAGHKEILYNVWVKMRQRCFNPNNKAYDYYGYRGIDIDPVWDSFVNFQKWALENGYKEGLLLDRINNDGNYSPDNCRFTTQMIQNRNTRKNVELTAFGETKIIADWGNDPRCRCSSGLLYWRKANGWSDEAAITTPIRSERSPTISAFGEMKTIRAWIRDPRCRVTYKVLWQRINNNRMSPEIAITKRGWKTQ